MILSVHTMGTIGYVLKGDDLYVLDTEGVGPSKPVTDDDKVSLGLYRKWENSTEIMPVMNVRIGRTDMLSYPVTADAVPLEDFIRTFGGRLEGNFHTWHRVLS